MKIPTLPLRRFTALACFACGLIGASVQLASSDELDSTMSQVLNAVISDSSTSADKAALQGELQSLQRQATANSSSASSSAGSGNSTGSTVAVASRSAVTTPKGCQGNLQYLDAQLPKYTDPTLVTFREQLLGQSVTETMRDAKAKGYDKPRAVSELLDGAASADKSAQQAQQCAIATTGGPDSDTPWTNWNSHSTQELQCEGILGGCKCGYVMGRYTSIVTRALAAQLSTCWN